MSGNTPNYGSLQGQGEGNKLSQLNGSVTYTTPPVNLGNNWSANGYVQRSGALNSFDPKTGSNGGGVQFTKRF